MKELTFNEINEVSGARMVETLGKTALTSGGAALGSYLSAVRLGATFGAAAGPMGAVLGGLLGAGIAYAYYK